jgi:hypothetical protein
MKKQAGSITSIDEGTTNSVRPAQPRHIESGRRESREPASNVRDDSRMQSVKQYCPRLRTDAGMTTPSRE